MTIRVIQWATGAMGRACLRAVLDTPGFTLVGLFAYGKDKIGRDAGEIVRRPPTGIVATGDLERLLQTEADVVIHAARIGGNPEIHDETLLRLLAAGKSVITINGHTNPPLWRAERHDRFMAACKAGGARFMGAGLNPGYAAEKLAVAASGISTRVTALTVTETVDCREVRSPEYVFEVLGFGSDPERVNPNDPAWGPTAQLNPMYEEALTNAAASVGLSVERLETRHRLLPATEDLRVAAGEIPRGRASHFDWRWRGHCTRAVRFDLNIVWMMETAHLDSSSPPLWRLTVEGVPCVAMDVALSRPDGFAERTSAEQLGLAATVLNAIPALLAAPPGIHAAPAYAPWRAPGSL